MQIGMELHDNVQQILAASLLMLDYAKDQFNDPASALEGLQDVKVYVNKGIHELRRLSHQLAPAMRTPEGLAEKINELISSMNAGGRLNVEVSNDTLLRMVRRMLKLAGVPSIE